MSDHSSTESVTFFTSLMACGDEIDEVGVPAITLRILEQVYLGIEQQREALGQVELQGAPRRAPFPAPPANAMNMG